MKHFGIYLIFNVETKFPPKKDNNEIEIDNLSLQMKAFFHAIMKKQQKKEKFHLMKKQQKSMNFHLLMQRKMKSKKFLEENVRYLGECGENDQVSNEIHSLSLLGLIIHSKEKLIEARIIDWSFRKS